MTGLLLACLLNSVGCGSSSSVDPSSAHPVVVGNAQISSSTVAHWERAISLGAASVPGDSDRTKAVSYLVSGYWLIEEAAEEHLPAVSDEPMQRVEQHYGPDVHSPKTLEQKLAAKDLTTSDIELEARIARSAAALRKAVVAHVGTASPAEVKRYYERHNKLFFHEQRSVDLIEQLHSRTDAELLARKLGVGQGFSKRALREVVNEPIRSEIGTFNRELVRAIFAAPVQRLGGPVRYAGKWVIFVVRQVFREPAPLAEVSEEIAERLRGVHQRQALEAFATKYRREWSAKTHCRTGFVAPGCSESPTRLNPEVNPLAA